MEKYNLVLIIKGTDKFVGEVETPFLPRKGETLLYKIFEKIEKGDESIYGEYKIERVDHHVERNKENQLKCFVRVFAKKK